jgi:RNA-binding protein YlmH
MTKFNVRDLEIIKNAKFTSSTLKRQLGNMLESSGNCRAIVESLNRETGEYQIVLQGTIETRDNF